MDAGTYTLLLALDEPVRLEVGALGERSFGTGAYAYTGSAFGAGGFARVDHHHRLAGADDGPRHWHLDYLLPHVTVEAVFPAAGAAIECEVARSVPGERVEGFGASDGDCDSHLAFESDGAALRRGLERRYADWPDRRA